SPPPRRPNVDLAHPARNERLHTGYERVIRLSFTKHNRCPRRHESINATVQLNIESDSRISGRRLRSCAGCSSADRESVEAEDPPDESTGACAGRDSSIGGMARRAPSLRWSGVFT